MRVSANIGQRAADVLTSAVHGACLFNGLCQHTQGVVQRALGLVQDLLRRPTQDDGARFTCAQEHKGVFGISEQLIVN